MPVIGKVLDPSHI